MWYAASAILAVEITAAEQPDFPVWENVYLIQADSAAAAWRLAEERGRRDETSSEDGFTYEGKPARLTFKGVRKVIACEPADEVVSGMEVMYSFMVAPSKEDVAALVAGESATVLYEE